MAISSGGIASGLDVDSIITGLMATEKLPLQRLQRQQTATQNKISAMGQIKSSIAALQAAAKAIASSSSIYSYKGTLADSKVASVVTNSSASAGSYSVEIEQLATNHKLSSAAGLDVSGGGTLTLQIGSTASGSFVAKDGTSPINVTVNAGATLTDVASAINSADAGIGATVINGAAGKQLVLTSLESGEINQIKIDSTIAGLDFDPELPATPGNLSQSTEAKNAILRIDGITIANTTSNVVTDAITGVTLTLTQTNNGTPTQLTIANDTSSLEKKLQTFVDAYNTARKTMKDLSKYDPEGQSTGVLNGDSSVSSMLNQLRGMLSTVPGDVSDSFPYLSDMGIESNADGTLKLNSEKLQSAVKSDFGALAKSIAAYGSAFEDLTASFIDSDGLVTSRLDGLNTTKSNLSDKIIQAQKMLDIVQARYEAQFTALEKLLSSMQTTSSFLTQQLSSLNSLRSS